MDRARIALIALTIALAACATTGRSGDAFKDRIRSCGTAIGACGSVQW